MLCRPAHASSPFATALQWTNASAGVCAAAECHRLERAAQWGAGRRLLDAFLPAALGAAPWSDFADVLAAGEQARTRRPHAV